jgi:hypothetical protein
MSLPDAADASVRLGLKGIVGTATKTRKEWLRDVARHPAPVQRLNHP